MAVIHETHSAFRDENECFHLDILLADKPTQKGSGYLDEPSLILTFGPGTIRFLRRTDITMIKYQQIIREVHAIGIPAISMPDVLPLISTNDPGARASYDNPKITLGS